MEKDHNLGFFWTCGNKILRSKSTNCYEHKKYKTLLLLVALLQPMTIFTLFLTQLPALIFREMARATARLLYDLKMAR